MGSLQTLHDLCLLLMFFVVPWLLIAIPIRRFIIFVKKDSKLQQKKKEKQIELLQAQIDSLKRERGT